MADDTSIESDIGDNPQVEAALETSGAGRPKGVQKSGPQYRLFNVDAGTRIPVGKGTGTLWKARIDNAKRVRKSSKAQDAWDEAIRYYNHDQLGHRVDGQEEAAGNRANNILMSDGWSETENIVFSTVSVMTSMLYAKNPTFEVAPSVEERDKGFTEACEELLNRLVAKRTSPGINLKPKARRGIVITQLTNTAYLEVGWTFKEDSSEELFSELETISQELANAKTPKEIERLEGELQALEDQIEVAVPEGPFARVLGPHKVLIDPDANEADHSDARWIATWDMLPSTFLAAKYGQRMKEDGQVEYRSVYKPTHVLKLGDGNSTDSTQEHVNTFSILADGDDYKAHGFDDAESFEKSQLCKVWYVWDKTTRRVYLFHDKDWKWPLWVWNDPYKLEDFFPFVALHFHESTEGTTPKGEVTYYLDQQDAINEINTETALARSWAKRNLFFDTNGTNLTQEDVEKVIKGPDGTIRGVSIPEGKKPEDIIFSIVPPSLKYEGLFNKQDKYAVIDRTTGLNNAMRGAEFRTNTTNDAVAAYNSAAEVRTGEKIDLIEDWLSIFAYKLLQLCVQNFSAEQVADIVGVEYAKSWQKMSPRELNKRLRDVGVTVSSTQKSNTKERRAEAIQLGQVLGQFANAAPAVVMILLKMLERSFDDLVINDKDWEKINQTMMMAQQQAGAGPQGGAPGGGQGMPSPEELKSLPPQAKEQIKQLIDQGMPPKEAVMKVLEAARSGQQQQPPQQQ